MRYDEFTHTITGSSPEDWEVIAIGGSLHLDRLTEIISGDGQHWVEVESHSYLAVYEADVDVRLAWGLETDRGLTYEGLTFSDPLITRELVDGFWRGALAARWSVLSADGHRCFLPDPERAYVQTGDSVLDVETVGWTARASEIALARRRS